MQESAAGPDVHAVQLDRRLLRRAAARRLQRARAQPPLVDPDQLGRRTRREPLLDPLQRRGLALRVGNVECGELPAFAEEEEPQPRAPQRPVIERRAAQRRFDLPQHEGEDDAEDRFADGAGFLRLRVPPTRDQRSPPARRFAEGFAFRLGGGERGCVEDAFAAEQIRRR